MRSGTYWASIRSSPSIACSEEPPRRRHPPISPVPTPGAGLDLGFEHFKLPVLDGLSEGREGMARTVKMLNEVRQAIGPARSLMIDCSSRWDDVHYCIEMARRLAHLDLYFIEEPLSPDNVLGYQQLVSQIDSTRIASGEHEYTQYGFTLLFEHNAVEVVPARCELVRRRHRAAADCGDGG